MRIRMMKRPHGTIEGIDVTSLHPGSVYEVSAELGSALLLLGYASVEMRRAAERRSAPRQTGDRRHR
jgi:hypothetical protein